MSRNNQSNLLIKRLIIFGDYVFLNMVVLGFCLWQQQMVLKRVVLLVSTQTVLAYFILKIVDYNLPVGWHLLKVGTFLMIFMWLPSASPSKYPIINPLLADEHSVIAVDARIRIER